jgi:hypothetical protein
VRVVEESKASGLSPDQAREVLTTLQVKVAAKPNRRLSLEWRIEETEGER